VSTLSSTARARIRAEVERSVSPEEARAYLEAPVSEREREDVLALVRWFRRRYPTGADRLAYVRRAYRRWSAMVTTPDV
jgi:hypothetical protein